MLSWSKSRYSQQIYLMLASWRNEGEHRIPLKELESQLNQEGNSLELSRTSTKKVQPAPTIQGILNDVKSELDALKADIKVTFPSPMKRVGERSPSRYWFEALLPNCVGAS
jgi:hypothetical protein